MKSILLLLIITLLGCSSNMKQEPISKSGIPVINLSEDVSTVPSLLLSESAEKLEIVPLEMTDQSMLGEIRRIQVTEHDIWIHDFNKFYIYRFSRTGKFLNRIGSIGQAPGEYVNFSTFLVDEYKKEVYIISNNNGILVYNFKGEFKKKIVDQQTINNLFSSVYSQYILYNGNFFAAQNIALYKLIDKHGIAKTKEAISFLYCLLIGCHDMFPAGKGRNQHDKRGFRKVEVCDQAIQDLKLVSRIDKDLSPAASDFQDPVIAGCRFQGTAARGSNADHTSAICLCIVDLLRLGLFYDIEFRVHVMIFDGIDLYRAEGSETDMESYMSDLNTHLLDLLQKFFCEMQSCCRSGRRTLVLGIYSLITVFIL